MTKLKKHELVYEDAQLIKRSTILFNNWNQIELEVYVTRDKQRAVYCFGVTQRPNHLKQNADISINMIFFKAVFCA